MGFIPINAQQVNLSDSHSMVFDMRMKKHNLMILIFILVCISLGIYLYLNQAIFGKLIYGKRLERIQNSERFQKRKFQKPKPNP
jgi:ethanolamine transporter EutH